MRSEALEEGRAVFAPREPTYEPYYDWQRLVQTPNAETKAAEPRIIQISAASPESFFALYSDGTVWKHEERGYEPKRVV